MAIHKITPRYLNFEDDERLVKRVEMTDAVNIRIDSDDDGDAGVVKNVAGNTQVSFVDATADALPSGDNKVIGSVRNNVKGELMFFVHNSNGNHRIYKYIDSIERVVTVYKNEATGTVASASADTLGFKATDYVDAAVLVDKDGDTLLYFTNGRGEPKKINVDKAIRGDYPDGYEAVEAYISLIKKPPLEPPTFVFNSDPEIKTNRFLGRQFQFACQYVYEDGEVSAISPITEITKSVEHQDLGLNSNEALQSIHNKVVITCKRTNSDIRKIRFLAREGNVGVFFIIKDVDTQFSSDSNSTVSVEFSNEKAYTPISNDENNKQFDAVGEDVQSITISGNRIFLGNYKEGFDLNDKGSISLNPNYHLLTDPLEVTHPDDVSVGVASANAFTNGMYTGHVGFNGHRNNPYSGMGDSKKSMFTKLDLDAAGIDADCDFNSYRSFSLSVSFSNIKAQYFAFEQLGNLEQTNSNGFLSKITPLRFSTTTELTGRYSSRTEIRDAIVDDINKLNTFKLSVSPYGSGGAAANGAGYYGEIEVKVHALGSITYQSQHLSGDNCITLFLEPRRINVKRNNRNTVNYPVQRPKLNDYGLLDEPNSSNNKFSFSKSRGCIFLGVNCNAVGLLNESDTAMSFKAGANHAFGIVYQDKNGRLSTVRPIGEKNVEWFDSSVRDGNAGRTSMVVRIPSTDTPPENAVRWMPVYAGNTDVGNFIQYTVNDAFKASKTDDNGVPDGVNIENKLYVSARGFQGKENSYIETFDPEISYTHAKGDIMKIVSVDNEDGEPQRSTDKEFRVIGYKDLVEGDSPILTSTTNTYDVFERTGSFFVIQKKANENEFTDSATNTDTKFRKKCLVEIRSPKFSTENQVYYQMGKSYDIQNGVHKGEDRKQYLTYTSLTGINGSYTLTTLSKVYVGDTIVISGLSPSEFVVYSVSKKGDTYEVKVTSQYQASADITPDTYTSDFTTGVDGFSQLDVANNSVSRVASVTDDFGTVVNNVLQLNCTDTVSAKHLVRKNNPLSSSIEGKNLLCSFKMLVDGDNTGLVRASLSDGRTTSLGVVEEGKVVEKGRWHTFTDIPFTQDSSQTRLIFMGLDSSDNPTFAAGTNDKFYIADVVLQEADISVSGVDDDAVIELDNGDVYFRKRILNYGHLNSTTNTSSVYIDYVEDYRFTDFISTVSNDFGKPNAFSEEAARVQRLSSLTYSDAYVMDSDRLSLTSFNNSLANFLDIKNKYGAIRRLVDIEDAFYAVQEHKVTLFPVNRNVLKSAAGDATVTLSTDVVNVNSSKSFAGDYGCGSDPETVVYYDGVLYFADRKANKVFSISSSGIKEISDIFADSYIADKLNKADKGGEYNIYSGIDPNNDEYLLSTRTIINKDIDVDGGGTYTLPSNSGSGKTDFIPASVNRTSFGSFQTMNFNFEDIDVNFEDLGNGVFYVDDAFSDNAMELDTAVDSLSSGTTKIVYTDKNNTFLGVAQVDNTNKFVELDPS